MNLDSDDLSKIRRVMRYEIRSRGLNYRSLSESTGISYLKIRRIMSNQEPKLAEFIKILKFLEIDIFKLFDEPAGLEDPKKVDLIT